MQDIEEQVVDLFKGIRAENFYGTLIFQIQEGNIQLVRVEQTIVGSDVLPKTLKSISGKTAEETP